MLHTWKSSVCVIIPQRSSGCLCKSGDSVWSVTASLSCGMKLKFKGYKVG
jgi:hypothetical protein